MDPKCKNCGYFDPEDQKCYYSVDQYIYFDIFSGEKPPTPMHTQPDDDGCENWTPKERRD